MSIQRWDDDGYGPCRPDPEGAWVRYADHVAAFTGTTMKHLHRCPSSSPDPLAADCQCTRLRACQEDMRAACIAAVEALPPFHNAALLHKVEDVLAALREVQP